MHDKADNSSLAVIGLSHSCSIFLCVVIANKCVYKESALQSCALCSAHSAVISTEEL